MLFRPIIQSLTVGAKSRLSSEQAADGWNEPAASSRHKRIEDELDEK
jgi:hypothetical protein